MVLNLKNWLNDKLISPIQMLIKQGITANKLAITISLGICVGLFPIIGCTTIICTILAIYFRLNMVIIQVINYLMYPLQLITIVPFILLGNVVLGVDNPVDLSNFIHLFKEDLVNSLVLFKEALIAALIGWLIAMPLFGLITYGMAYFFLQKLVK